MQAVIRYIRREPVRSATVAVAAAIVAVALASGASVESIVAQVVGAAAILERVRKAVAPMVNVIVHADDLEPADLPTGYDDAAEPAAPSTPDVAPEQAQGEPLSEADAAAILADTEEAA